ncbi:MAG TPA: CDP-2,3-bis-(O-geranylgeranyl)-sn-glycerol synthase [Thermoplasmatales archaeon]|nr:CDP-2,3-bis-(O-geranylgeranyl)-sn-glycerol synthase [Thermoplasmatales archaeon]
MIDILRAIWLIFPSYVANASAVLLKGKTPVDFGRKWRNKPIFGRGKTWRGLAGGTLAGLAVGTLMNQIYPTFSDGIESFLILFSLAFGALFGDLMKSFFKRRIGKERGEKWIVADQIDFLLGSFLICFLMNREWFLENFKLNYIAFLLIFTPLLHLVTNILAYALKLKKVPW